nr:uncharacterized protein LOC116430341 isoform X3 [Nomia melanderi]
MSCTFCRLIIYLYVWKYFFLKGNYLDKKYQQVMNKLVESVIRKYLNPRIEGTTNENFYTQLRILNELIKLLCYLIENKKKHSLERQTHRDAKLENFTRIMEENVANVQQWTVMLQEQRSYFINFQRKIELESKAMEILKTNTYKNLEHVLTIQAREFSSKVLSKNYKCNIKRRSLQKEADLHKSHLKFTNKIYNLQESNLRSVHSTVKKQCLDQLRMYDKTIKMLYTCEIALLRDKEGLEKDYAIIQVCLISFVRFSSIIVPSRFSLLSFVDRKSEIFSNVIAIPIYTLFYRISFSNNLFCIIS